jgi:hypothetical protein
MYITTVITYMKENLISESYCYALASLKFGNCSVVSSLAVLVALEECFWIH